MQTPGNGCFCTADKPPGKHRDVPASLPSLSSGLSLDAVSSEYGLTSHPQCRHTSQMQGSKPSGCLFKRPQRPRGSLDTSYYTVVTGLKARVYPVSTLIRSAFGSGEEKEPGALCSRLLQLSSNALALLVIHTLSAFCFTFFSGGNCQTTLLPHQHLL